MSVKSCNKINLVEKYKQVPITQRKIYLILKELNNVNDNYKKELSVRW